METRIYACSLCEDGWCFFIIERPIADGMQTGL